MCSSDIKGISVTWPQPLCKAVLHLLARAIQSALVRAHVGVYACLYARVAGVSSLRDASPATSKVGAAKV